MKHLHNDPESKDLKEMTASMLVIGAVFLGIGLFKGETQTILLGAFSLSGFVFSALLYRLKATKAQSHD